MGPKKAAAVKEVPVEEPPVVELSADFTASIRISVNKEIKHPEHLTFRIISEWTKCSTTPAFAYHADKWVADKIPVPVGVEGEEAAEVPVSKIHCATFSEAFQPHVSGDVELTTFNTYPGMYVVLMAESHGKHSPIGFAYLDCSRFLADRKSVV